jgi:hypothetical protein
MREIRTRAYIPPHPHSANSFPQKTMAQACAQRAERPGGAEYCSRARAEEGEAARKKETGARERRRGCCGCVVSGWGECCGGVMTMETFSSCCSCWGLRASLVVELSSTRTASLQGRSWAEAFLRAAPAAIRAELQQELLETRRSRCNCGCLLLTFLLQYISSIAHLIGLRSTSACPEQLRRPASRKPPECSRQPSPDWAWLPLLHPVFVLSLPGWEGRKEQTSTCASHASRGTVASRRRLPAWL